jgi:uncharacterized protein YyaL (SSP411 family)
MNTTEHVTNKGQGTTRIPNNLAKEKSPYLLQHAYNPVKWYPWDEEAFVKAKEENKPIFLSIGYSTCHWCHVMEVESFEDQEVADYMNRYFVAIKVDKEERPDVDSIYMSVCQKISGSGGWPLTIFMLPNQEPFFAGTYFPKRSRNQMPGLLNLLEAVKEKWETNREEIINSSASITKAIKEENIQTNSQTNRNKELPKQVTRSLIYNFDKEYGGFGFAPKFPTPHNLMYLLRVAYHEQNQEALQVVEKTLNSMYHGGIFDHIGYGFSRYSTDNKWLVPHFEKMLYDNGLLIITYLEAYQITKREHYKQIAEMTMEYVLRELTDDQGGFYCAQDADSEGVEGKYYVFTPEEIIGILGEKDGKHFNEYYDITEPGNFEGKNIPNRIHAQYVPGLETDRISQLRNKVFSYRFTRTKLHKDDKILTSWNGIMMVAFTKAYLILQDEKYLQAAKSAGQFIQDKLSNGDRLFVHYRDGVSIGNGHIDDYAFYIWALLELYEVTFELEYLTRAVKYTKVLIQQFFDASQGGFFLYAEDSEVLIHRPKELYDGAIPSGNSVAAYVLLKLTSLTGDIELTQATEKQMNYIANSIADYPSGHCFSMMAVLLEVYPTKELVCVVKDLSDVTEMKKVLAKQFIPNITVLVKTSSNSKQLEQIAEFTKNYEIKGESKNFYLCQNHACMAPFHEIEELEKLLIQS